MNREDFVSSAAERCGMPVPVMDRALSAVLAELELALAGEGSVELPGFGDFAMLRWRGRTRPDVNTGEPSAVGDRFYPAWRPSRALRARLRR